MIDYWNKKVIAPMGKGPNQILITFV